MSIKSLPAPFADSFSLPSFFLFQKLSGVICFALAHITGNQTPLTRFLSFLCKFSMFSIFSGGDDQNADFTAEVFSNSKLISVIYMMCLCAWLQSICLCIMGEKA